MPETLAVVGLVLVAAGLAVFLLLLRAQRQQVEYLAADVRVLWNEVVWTQQRLRQIAETLEGRVP